MPSRSGGWLAAAMVLFEVGLLAAPITYVASPGARFPYAPPRAGETSSFELAGAEVAAARASLASNGGPASKALFAGNWTMRYPTLESTYGNLPTILMAYDAADGYVVLLGGFVAPFAQLPTWAFYHGRWTELRAVGPRVDSGAAMAYDAADREVVLFGGLTGAGGHFGNLTWVFHGGNWSALTSRQTHAPSPRFGPSLAYDAADRYLVLFGGVGLGDTWKFSGGRWTQLLAGSPTGPSVRYGGLMAYDAALGKVVLIGGQGSWRPGHNRAITWTYHAGLWTALNVSSPPGAQTSLYAPWNCLDYDAGLGGLVMVTINPGGLGAPAQTWEFNGTWQQLALPREPTALNVSVCTSDPRFGGVVLIGGPTWALVGRNWSVVNDSLVPAHAGPSVMAYDVRDAEVVWYGWYDPYRGANNYYAQTWTFAHRVWTQLTNLTRVPPVYLGGMSMTYDAADSYVLLFAGEPNQTWSFAAGQWTSRTGAVGPSPRAYAGLAYYGRSGRVVLFGGTPCNVLLGYRGCPELNDTWTFLHGTWSRVPVAFGRAPPGRESAVFVDDIADGYLLLSGGMGCASQICTAMNDTWSFNGSGWTLLASSVAPRPFLAAAATYDAHIGAVVVFGGCGPYRGYYGAPYYHGTWAYTGGHWSAVNVSPSQGPQARCGGLLAFVPGTGRDLYIGVSSLLVPSFASLGDVWALRLS
ncbi:MAG TPA: hypothetical protein VFG07_10050 [Thermoplasmata archaeon]|nr:hypothetical protein [Thermoplasmata archaeon]